MNLPKVIADLVKAQDEFDAETYAGCFSDTAVVFDEGRTHRGRNEIKLWIDKANREYRTVMTPIEYTQSGQTGVLKAKISGTFPGSPVTLDYHFSISNGQIDALKITG